MFVWRFFMPGIHMNGSTNMSTLHMEYTVCTCTAAIVKYVHTYITGYFFARGKSSVYCYEQYVVLVLILKHLSWPRRAKTVAAADSG
jgi:hypothetical protein